METRQFTSRRLDRGRLYLVDGVQSPNSLAIRVLEQVPADVRIRFQRREDAAPFTFCTAATSRCSTLIALPVLHRTNMKARGDMLDPSRPAPAEREGRSDG